MLAISRNIISKLSIFCLLTVAAFAAPESSRNFSGDHCLCLAEQAAPDLTAPDLTAPDLTAPDLTAPNLTWTAFKFSEKTGVGGAFSDIKVHYRHDAHSLEDFLASGEFSASVNSVSTGNPIRDETLRKSFFSLFTNDKVHGKVEKVEADSFVMNTEMNGQEKPITFKYTLTNEGILSASSTFDMLDFGLKEAHDSIHKACEKLHTGPDGVSKTWTEVALNVKAKIRKDCACN